MSARVKQVLVALLLIGAAAWFYNATEWVDVPLPPKPDAEVLRDPNFAAKALLRQLGATVEEQRTLEALPPPGATIVLSTPHWHLFPQRVVALRAFIEAGGHLVMPDELSAVDDELHWLPIDVDLVKQPAETARTGVRCHSRLEGGTRPAFEPRRALTVCARLQGEKLTPRVPPSWSLAGPDGLDVVRVPLGRGRITMTMYSHLYRNDELPKGDNALLFAATLDLRRGDRVVFITSEERPPLAELLRTHGLAALVAATLTLAFALWRAGMRFGPREAVAPPSRRSMREQIAGTAAFIAARGGTPLHRAQLRALERAAASHIAGYERLASQADRAQAIGRAAALDPQALARAMDGTPRRPPRALAAALALLETARRQLLTLSTTKKHS